MKHDFDVLVVGGGIVGLTAALSMAKQAYSVALIDAALSLTSNSSRVYAINHASESLLKRLGVWEFLESKRISPYQGMYVWDALSTQHIEFDARQIAASNLGHIIEESVLKAALIQAIALYPNIHLFTHSAIDNIQQKTEGIRISCQEQVWEGRLLMVADGANSPIRQQLNVPLNTWSYHQQAITASVSTEKPHRAKAYQVFHPDGPLAFLPLKDAHQCSIVWSTTARAQELMALDDKDFSEAVCKSFEARLGKIKLLGSRHQFPLHMRHVKQYVGPHWLLLGDAAHTIHPLAGLGLNVGLADVHSWMMHMDRGKNSGFSNKQLGAYQRERKYAVWQVILLMEAFKRVFCQSFGPLVLLRGLGLSTCNESKLLKRFFIQQAVG